MLISTPLTSTDSSALMRMYLDRDIRRLQSKVPVVDEVFRAQLRIKPEVLFHLDGKFCQLLLRDLALGQHLAHLPLGDQERLLRSGLLVDLNHLAQLLMYLLDDVESAILF